MGMADVVPESVKRAFAIEPDTWIDLSRRRAHRNLMQENRLFDHALGTLQGVSGFNDPRAIR
jgi:phospholipase C